MKKNSKKNKVSLGINILIIGIIVLLLSINSSGKLILEGNSDDTVDINIFVFTKSIYSVSNSPKSFI